MTPLTFRTIRKSLGLSQAEMAYLLRIEDRQTISRYERGKRKVSGPVSLLMDLLDIGAVKVAEIEGLSREIEQ